MLARCRRSATISNALWNGRRYGWTAAGGYFDGTLREVRRSPGGRVMGGFYAERLLGDRTRETYSAHALTAHIVTGRSLALAGKGDGRSGATPSARAQHDELRRIPADRRDLWLEARLEYEKGGRSSPNLTNVPDGVTRWNRTVSIRETPPRRLPEGLGRLITPTIRNRDRTNAHEHRRMGPPLTEIGGRLRARPASRVYRP